MYIFIDESGSFVSPKNNQPSISAVGALTISESRYKSLCKRFKKLTGKWGFQGKEVKGKLLLEGQVSAVIDLLLNIDAKLHICATDTSIMPLMAIEKHRDEQAKRVTTSLTEAHNPNLVRECELLSQELKSLPLQLYLQFSMMNVLITRQLRDSNIYFAFVRPSELSHYKWIIDAKAQSQTTYEKLWKLLGSFLIQSTFLRTAFIQVKEGNYDYFKRFYKLLDEWLEHLPPLKDKCTEGPIEVIDIGKIMSESVILANSKDRIGLQLADICVNTFRRALMGNLKYPSWSRLGELMLRLDKPAVSLITLNPDQMTENETVAASFVGPIKLIEEKSQYVLPE